MLISQTKLKGVYEEVIDEYNISPLAIAERYVYLPTQDKFDEISAIVEAMRPGGTFVDIGTGMGIAARCISKLGCRVFTLDNPLTGGNALANLIGTEIEGLQCDILKDRLPFEDGTVDAVLFADVIEHLLHSPKSALKEFYRILRNDGICVASTPNAMRLSVRLKVFFGYSNWPHINDFFEDDYHGGHHKEYTIAEFREVFERSGFRVEEIKMNGTIYGVNIKGFNELQSRRRGGSAASTSTHPIIQLAKIPINLIEKMMPKLRPQMLLIAKKTN